MPFISNPVFSDTEKRYLEYVLQHDFFGRVSAVDQLNGLTEGEIRRDVTPYHWILEFRPGGVNPGQGPMSPWVTLSVGAVPTVFTLYERNGFVFELEIYNADSSALDPNTILDGKIRVHPAGPMLVP